MVQCQGARCSQSRKEAANDQWSSLDDGHGAPVMNLIAKLVLGFPAGAFVAGAGGPTSWLSPPSS